MKENYFLFLFILVVITVPFVYRFIRLGHLAWFVENSELIDDVNYKKAENFRVHQIFLGFSFFIFHGSIFWGLQNIVQLALIACTISMVSEIIGSKTGLIFGGEYKYNAKNTPGYVFMGIPVLIPIAWFGLIYMALNLALCIYRSPSSVDLDSSMFVLIFLPSIMLSFIDLVLDPLAVNENRWAWKISGKYYGIPILNFFGWFSISVLILAVFSKSYIPMGESSNEYSFLMEFSPGILFVLLHLIAARPCFERKLVIPGFIGIILFLMYLGLLLIL